MPPYVPAAYMLEGSRLQCLCLLLMMVVLRYIGYLHYDEGAVAGSFGCQW